MAVTFGGGGGGGSSKGGGLNTTLGNVPKFQGFTSPAPTTIGTGAGAYGNYAGSGSSGVPGYSSQPSYLSQGMTGIPGFGGFNPVIKSGDGSQAAPITPSLFGGFNSGGGVGGVPGFGGFPPLKDLLGQGGGISGGGSASANRIPSQAESQANDFLQWQRRQVKNQASFDQQAAGKLGEGFQGLVENYNTAYGAANTANEARYQELLSIADATTDQRKADVSSAFNQQGADAQQRLAGLGMSNTTIAPTLMAGIERERQHALNRTADQMQQTKLGIIERKEDNFPDLASLQSIIGGTGSAFGTRGIDAMLQAFGNVRSV